MIDLKVEFQKKSLAFAAVIAVLSIVSFCVILLDVNRPDAYFLLPLMPLTYMLVALCFIYMFDFIPSNFGATLILFFEGLRLVIAPMILVFSNYCETIHRGAENNTPMAIVLMIYECIVVFLVMGVLARAEKIRKVISFERNINAAKYRTAVLFFLLVTILLVRLEPQILNGYRTIFGMTDVDYTSVELSNVINEVNGGFVSKFSMVMSVYLIVILRIAIPAGIIVWLSKRKKTLGWAIIVALTPFLIVDGTIGRSIYISAMMFYMIYYVYNSKSVKNIFRVGLVFVAGFIILFWSVRYSLANSDMSYIAFISKILTDYFCGINMVSGALNLEAPLDVKFVYFIADVLKSIPFGNTIFNFGNVSYFQPFFDKMNGVIGMIPPAVGSGYFYFGILLAPIYSAFFSGISFVQGNKANREKDAYQKIKHLSASLFFALSFNMYSVQTTFSLLFGAVIPLYIIAAVAEERSFATVQSYERLR